MSCVAALLTGVGLGLAYFGGLWLTLRQAVRRPFGRGLIAASRIIRLVLFGLAFSALSREGIGIVLAALVGFWAARWHLILHLGGGRHGR